MNDSTINSFTKKQLGERIKARKKMSKAQIQLAIIKKKQCDARALKIVEQLLEPIVETQWLLQNLQHINKSHMEDVIEERAIVKLCGYVLCKNPITVIITQKFHISTKRNKVYDVTRRKNFCSSYCYGACNYLLEQMLTSPLWLREQEEIPVFHLLSSNLQTKRDMLGDEVYVNDILSENDKEYIEPAETFEEAESQILDEVTNVYDKLPKSNDKVSNIISNEHTVFENTSSEYSVPKSVQTEDFKVHNNNLKSYQDTIGNIKASNLSTNTKYSNETNENFNEQTEIIQKCYEVPVLAKNSKTLLDCEKHEKIIENTSNIQIVEKKCEEDKKINEFIIIKQNILDKKEYPIENEKDKYENVQKMNNNKVTRNASTKNIRKKKISEDSEQSSTKFYALTMRVEKSVKEWITEDTISFLQGDSDIRLQLMENFIQHERYVQLCKKLNKLQLQDEKEDCIDLSSNTLKPLPHFSILQEEADKIELKVHAFYEGRMVIDQPKKVVENNETCTSYPILPLIDAHAPKALRRKIFLDKLHKILPDLLRMLADSTRCYTIMEYINDNSSNTLIKGLVNTFSLSASNIIFKTAEWTLVGLIIIKMLSIMDPQLKILLATKQASIYISMVLMSYKLDSYYLDRFIIELTNNPKIFEIK
ncbi:putative RNA polymerase II subunit B1 CTD phosphatase RPAP2 [Vespa crabro]|uniref:putative RNA polymerase II subunit B1 CTD phosphatase RPAP2 n=1 Tax=Vespa crabro TaxID=7445 RepID=UPI001F018286|nr:putative RNA polymerase II subunit B1 CTD phosphatase RPAP2 [Vespa crabro]XP_046837638.1 putative RNA polymerase II subunit B1 CTD phosphatase RPAP2 [Vespa crabro]